MGKSPCCDHKNGLKKGPWTADEDQKLIDYIHRNGYGNWRTLPRNAGLQRCGKSCRLRWTNYLRPDIKRGRFSLEEEQLIIHLHSILGNKWSAIASRLPGRTDNEIKNYWNTHIRKTLIRMGIDPVTHCPTPLYYHFLHLSSEMLNSSPDHHMFIAMTSSTNPPLMLSQNHKEYFTPQITTSHLQTTLIHQDLTHLIPTAPHLNYKPQNPKPNFALEHFGQVNDDQWQQSQLSYPTGDGGGYDYGGLEDHPIPNSTMDETGSNYSGLQSVSLAAPSCSHTPVVHSNNSSTCNNVYNYYYS